jgi:choline-sulfatase
MTDDGDGADNSGPDTSGAENRVRPNFLFVLADQVVPFLTAPYGDPVAQTPAMAELAADGVTFDAAYTPAPLCSPARASFFTGRDASAIGCFDNASVMPPDVPTIGHYLSADGYDTVLSGKMHFVGPDQLHGFRHRLTTDVFPAGVDWVPAVDEHGRFPAGGHARHYAGDDPGVRPWTQFLTFDEETQFGAVAYLRERMREEKPGSAARAPFCMVVSYHHPHDPFHVRQEYWDRYEGVDIPLPEYPADLEDTYSVMDRWANEAHETHEHAIERPDSLRNLRRAYYAALSYVDDKLAELLAVLRESGELENTVIVFTSDHGDMLAEKRMVQKRTFYEWSARIPLLLRLPGGAHAGTRVGVPVSLIDLLPTTLDLAGYPGLRADVDGETLLPLLEADDSSDSEGDRVVFSEYHLEKVWAPCFLVRRGPYKYVYVHGHDQQLFDLDDDPGEWNDLSNSPEHQVVRDELCDLLFARFDPEALARAGAASIPRRQIVAAAMRANDQHWDYSPTVDGTKRYIR